MVFRPEVLLSLAEQAEEKEPQWSCWLQALQWIAVQAGTDEARLGPS